MAANILSGIVCIGSKHIGTGFVVSADGLILTCSHVLGSSMPEKALIMFQGTGEEREATVLAEGWRGVDAEDVAVLKVSGALPAGIQLLPLGSSQGTEGHPMITFGYPETGEVEGIHGAGAILGRGARTKAGQQLLQVHSSEITKGFSGAPIWDETRQRVVGMVVIAVEMDELGKMGSTAFATPAETLWAICPALQVTDICPYRNLEAFTEADAALFFGRQRVIDTLVDNLQNEPRFLAVFGASGSGKSSVVQAGLIPQLRNGAVPGSDRWEIIVTRPMDSSFKQHLTNLNLALTPVALVIDQFEELFVSYDEATRIEIITQLTRLLERSSHVTLIIVMRDDFYSLFVQQETLAIWLKGRVVNVWSTMKREEVESIIREPANTVGWQFEDGLVELIVNDVLKTSTKGHEKVGSSTILPLLEFALTQLWERRQDGMLTRDAYRRVGGVTGGLTRWANEAYSRFDERLQPLVRRVFTDLIHLGNEEEHIADSRRRRELSSFVRTEAERADIRQVVQQLVTAHLLVVSQDTESKKETIEIIHDALLWEWGLLKQWVEEDRRFLTWHQELERPMHGWTTQRDKSKLLRGRDLTEAERWLKERRDDLNQDEVAFIHASARQRTQTFLLVTSVLLLLVLLAGTASVLLVQLSTVPKPPDPTRVTNLHDDGVGSLRWAIAYAPSGRPITFDTSLRGSILLSSGDLNIAKDLKILGPGAGILSISSGNNGHTINVSRGVSVTIAGFAFRDSHGPRSFILNEGKLQLINSTVSGNMVDMPSSGDGGGITNSGMLTLINSTVSGNRVLHPASEGILSDGGGGGIYNYNFGVLMLINSTVSDNRVFGGGVIGGGGIYNRSGTLIVTDSTISGNIAESGDGGGVYSDSGSLTFVNSTISDNVVKEGSGGGIESRYTIAGFFPSMTIVFSTIYDNKAQNGGGIAQGQNLLLGDYQPNIRASIIAGNHAGMHPNVDGELYSNGYNLIQEMSEVAFIPRGQNPTDRSIDDHDLIAMFGARPKLQNNGGVTEIYALRSGENNPAVDKIPRADCQIEDIDQPRGLERIPIISQMFTDQRGMKRPDGNEQFCDIGAYESVDPPT